MYRYFYKLNDDGTIRAFYKQKTTPKNCVEITEADYNAYRQLISGVERKEGYDLVIHLYPDFTFTVEYTPIEVVEVNEE